MIILSINGMSCDHCASSIEEALNALPEINQVQVSFQQQQANIQASEQLDLSKVEQIIVSLGFQVVKPEHGCQASSDCHSGLDNSSLHVVIIGSGSAAFAAAIKAAEAGARVSIIEADEVIGGCCVNVGCVPSKILIRAAELTHQQQQNPFPGIPNHKPAIDRAMLTQQQSARVDELRSAKYEQILDANPALTLIKGKACFQGINQLSVALTQGGEIPIEADRILIATGSIAKIPAIQGLAETPYWTSTDALFTETTPRSMIVIGASVVALELAQAFARLGTEVTILARQGLLSRFEPQLGVELADIFTRQGIRVLLKTEAKHISYNDQQFHVETHQGEIFAERLLISTGREANSNDLNLDAVGIKTNASGAILVNDQLQTSVKNIYAAGDCADIPQYVYVAAAAGSRAGINMTGGNARLGLSNLPSVVFTDPQVAQVGLTEQEARQQGLAVISRNLTLDNVPRALANFETEGFIKLVADASSEQLIGAQILAPQAGEIIQIAALAISQQMTISQLANQLFPYLTMAEGLKLCAQTFHQDVGSLSCCAG